MWDRRRRNRSFNYGFGMSRVMVVGASTPDMIIGIITGVVGLVICVLNYPVYAYIKNNKE